MLPHVLSGLGVSRLSRMRGRHGCPVHRVCGCDLCDLCTVRSAQEGYGFSAIKLYICDVSVTILEPINHLECREHSRGLAACIRYHTGTAVESVVTPSGTRELLGEVRSGSLTAAWNQYTPAAATIAASATLRARTPLRDKLMQRRGRSRYLRLRPMGCHLVSMLACSTNVKSAERSGISTAPHGSKQRAQRWGGASSTVPTSG